MDDRASSRHTPPFPGQSRRRFLATAASAATAFALAPRRISAATGATPSGEILRVACIGAGGQGGADLNAVAGDPGVRIVALCDVDLKRAAANIAKYSKARLFRDFRKMFDAMEKEIDAVIVGTPDHTHAVAAMAAIRRGKHVYCEKPLAHSVHEVRELMRASREKGVVTQLGNQGHSSESIRIFCEWIQAGAIGKVHTIHAGCRFSNSAIDLLPSLSERPPVPDTLDWDLWLGPAPSRPYHPAYCPHSWRRWVPFGNGTIGDWICHVVDPVFWALDLGAPKSVVAEVTDWDLPRQADAYPKGDHVTFEFAAKGARGPVTLHWYSGTQKIPRPDILEPGRQPVDIGAYVHGDKGVIQYGSHGAGGVRIVPEAAMKAYVRPPPTIPRLRGSHQADWLRAIRTGGRAGSDFSYGGPLTELALIGIVAMKLRGTKLEWDGAKGEFANSAAANRLLKPEFRAGWTL